jgi:hypothetical protein
MGIIDISDHYCERHFYYDAQGESINEVDITQDGNKVDFYMLDYDPYEGKKRVVRFKGNIVAGSTGLKVAKIQTTKNRLIWYDAKLRSIHSKRTEDFVYMKMRNFGFTDRHINRLLDVINVAIPIVADKNIQFRLLPEIKKYERYTFRKTNEVNGYIVLIRRYRKKTVFRLVTPLSNLYIMELGIFNIDKQIYFKTQWLESSMQKKIRNEVIHHINGQRNLFLNE